MAPRPNHATQLQSGIILLIVMGMLAVFSLLAISFLVFSGNSRSGSVALERPKQRGTPGDQLAEMVIKQVVRGTTDSSSGLHGQSLLEDVYGFQAAPLFQLPPATLLAYADSFEIHARSAAELLSTKDQAIKSSFLSIPMNRDALRSNSMNVNDYTPLVDDYFTGRLLTVVNGPLSGETFRIVRYRGGDVSANNDREFRVTIDLSEPNGIQTRSSLSSDSEHRIQLALTNPSSVINTGTLLLINSAPYRGSGFGVTEFPANSGNFDVNQTVIIPPAGSSYRPPIKVPLLGNVGRVRNALALAGQLISGSTAEDYDAPDYNDQFLAYNFAADSQNNMSSDIIPSFHRPAVINYLYHNLIQSSSTPPIDDVYSFMLILEAATNRPLSYVLSQGGVERYVRNRNFSGSNPGDRAYAGIVFPQLLIDWDRDNPRQKLDGYIALLTRGPWDVDTDNDLVTDSVWIDPNLPLITAADGKLKKLLVAINISDMDSRLNLSAHGTAETNAFNFSSPNNSQDRFLASTRGIPYGVGFGPAEISLRPIFSNPTFFLNRNGRDGKPGIKDVGSGPSLYPLFERNRFVANAQFRFPSIPSSIFGNSAVDVDKLGNVHLDNAIATEAGDDNPYRSSGNLVTYGDDQPFTLEELEAVLRVNDADYQLLPTRLRNMLSQSSLLTKEVLSRVTTTVSSDMPSPALGFGETGANSIYELIRQGVIQNHGVNLTLDQMKVLFPPEFRLGQKFDINHPLGNGQDTNNNGEVDEPAEYLVGNNTSEVENYPTTNGNQTNAGDLTRDNDQLLDLPAFVNDRTYVESNLSRAFVARYFYCLGQAIIPKDYDFPGTMGVTPALTAAEKTEIRARTIAQWAANIVDFRDSDVAMTRFAYDSAPFDGTDEWGYSGRIVWGLEFPELVFTETLSLHDVRAKDTYLDDDKGSTMRDPDQMKKDNDLDQYRVPLASSFWELYCPRATGTLGHNNFPGAPLSLYDEGPSGRISLNLSKYVEDPNNGVRQPVWRIVIGSSLENMQGRSAAAPTQDIQASYIDSNQRSFMGYQISASPELNGLFVDNRDVLKAGNAQRKVSIDRVVWFTNPIQTPLDAAFIPEIDSLLGGAPVKSRIYYNRTGQDIFVEGGGYAVIGPRMSTELGWSQQDFASTAAAQPPPPNDLRSIITNSPSPQRLLFENPGGPLSFSHIKLNGIDRYTPFAGVPKRVTGCVVAADIFDNNTAAANAWRVAYPNGIGVNISHPNPDELYAVNTFGYEAPTHLLNSNNNEFTNPPDAYCDVATNSGSFPDELFDVVNPNVQVPQGALDDNEEFRARTIETSRISFLQRLADPGLPFHPNLNPYIVVDWIPMDLSVFSGEQQNDYVNNFKLATRQKNGVDATAQLNPSKSYHSYKVADLPTTQPRAPGDPEGPSQPVYLDYKLGGANYISTLGFLNSEFGIPFLAGGTPADPEYCYNGMPDPSTSQIAGMPWFNRDYATPYELLLVPYSSPSQLNQQFTSLALPTAPGSSIYQRNNPNAQLYEPFGHIFNFLETPGASNNPQGLDLHRLFELVETPSRFAGTERVQALDVFRKPATDDTGQLWYDLREAAFNIYRAPYNKFRTFREPGKININTATRTAWQGIEFGVFADARQTPLPQTFLDRLNQFAESRTGYTAMDVNSDVPIALRNNRLNYNFPSEFVGVFRNTRMSQISAASLPQDREKSYQTGLLRPQLSNQTSRLFADTSGTVVNDPLRFYRDAIRLPNLTTTHSNIFKVNMTIGFFEYDPINGIGNEHVEVSGETKRHRAFYVIDRSIPVGYRTGEDLNTEKTILLRRYIK